MKTVKLNREIYNEKTVISAIDAYKDLCSIELTESEKYFDCCFENCKYDEALTACEFENYLIDLINCTKI